MDQSNTTKQSLRISDNDVSSKAIIQSRQQRYEPELRLRKKEAKLHVELLTGDENTPCTFATYDDRKDLPKAVEKIRAGLVYHDGDKLSGEHKYGSVEEVWPWVQKRNQQGCGVFVCIQEMDDSGKRETKNFVRVRTCVNDLDRGEPPTPYPDKRQPSFSVQSSKHGRHDYYLVDECSLPAFLEIQRGFARDWNGDKQIADPTRVMRLAGTFHRKTTTPFLVTVSAPDGDIIVYTEATLAEAFAASTVKAGATVQPQTGLSLANVNKAIETLRPKARYTLDQVRDALTYLREEADDRATWIKYGLALKRDFGDAAKSVWIEWASYSSEFDENDTDYRWETLRTDATDSPITVGSIITAAKEKGWKPKGEIEIESRWPVTRNDKPDAGSTDNVVFFLDEIETTPWYNEFNRKTYVRDRSGTDRCLDDDVMRDLRLQMHTAGCRVPNELFTETVLWLAKKQTAHPPRHYFTECQKKWDKKPRLDTWLTIYAGVEDTPYTRSVGRKWLVAAVRRVRDPGCKFDPMLVLEGPQYAGKSKLFRTLAAEWFTDSVELGDDQREVIENTANALIVECQEMSGIGRREIEAVKAFCSRQSDRARAAYGRFVSDVPRQFVLGGTTNDSRYLMDKTGNRRFWCVAVGEMDLAALERDRDQLWGEAATYEAQGDRIYLTTEEFDLATIEQSKREVIDPIEERIGDMIAEIKNGFISTEDLCDAVDLKEMSKRKDHHYKSIGRVMRACKWSGPERKRVGEHKRQRGYFNGKTAELSDRYGYDYREKSFVKRK